VSVVNSIFNFLRFNKRNWKAVVLCLIAATVFWIFNALNKTYSANISFPLAFDYDQEGYIPVKPLPRSVKMNVTGIGWELFKKSSGLKVTPLSIPLERPSEIKKIVGSTLPPHFSTQLEGLQINFVITDTLVVDIDENVKRKLSLAVDSIANYIHPDYGVVSDITISPDTCWVEGPKRLIHALPKVVNIKLPITKIEENFREEVTIDFIGSNVIKRNPPVTEVSFAVERFVEVSKKLPLTISDLPAKLKSAINIKEVNCLYRIPESQINEPADSAKATLNIKQLERGNHIVAPVVSGLPQRAKLIKVDSVRITF
jgi:YbbR domain-containing protein